MRCLHARSLTVARVDVEEHLVVGSILAALVVLLFLTNLRSTLISASFAVGATIPALAMTAVRGPSALVAASNMPSTSASTAMSPLSAMARPPPLAIA